MFIDAAKSQCDEYLDAVRGKLASSCMLVTDNTTTHAEDLASFIRRLRELPGFTSCAVAVGNGFELTVSARVDSRTSRVPWRGCGTGRLMARDS